MSKQRVVRNALHWGAVAAVVAVLAVASFIVTQRPWGANTVPISTVPTISTAPASDAPSPIIASSEAIEGYATLVLKAQKNFFARQQRYASTLEQLKLKAPTAGVTIDYRGSSPLGFCWLARTGGGVWYTISQTRVARSQQTVETPPPISCP